MFTRMPVSLCFCMCMYVLSVFVCVCVRVVRVFNVRVLMLRPLVRRTLYVVQPGAKLYAKGHLSVIPPPDPESGSIVVGGWWGGGIEGG